MNRSLISAVAVAAILASSCTVEETSAGLDGTGTDAALSDGEESGYVPGVTVVKFSEEMASLVGEDVESGNLATKSADLNDFISRYGITSIRRVFPEDPRWAVRERAAGMDLWYVVTFDSAEATPTRAASDFGTIPGVEIAEPDRRISLRDNYYNDQYYSMQWHLSGIYGIDVEPVWENFTKGSSDVIVAVVDTGIDMNHPDLRANLIEAGSDGGSWDFYDNTSTISAGFHGTHVAGIIAAVSDNDLGVAGIAGGDQAEGISGTKLLNIQVFNENGTGGTDDVFVKGIKYAADNGALICQNSWGYDYDSEELARRGTTSSVMKQAIDYFADYAGCDNYGNQLTSSKMKGGVVIFAAGNDGYRYGHPADYETCIAVGATDKYGKRADYSNYGDWVDICAPGTDIYSTYYSAGSTYGSLSGTSMACPMVSGVAALVLAYQGCYGFTADDLRECLIEGAVTDKVYATDVGPFLDALGAVAYGVTDPPLPITDLYASASSNIITFNWTVPAADESGESPAYGALLCASANPDSISDLDPKHPSDDVFTTSVHTDGYAVGDTATADITVDQFGTVYYVTAVPYNFGASYADAAGTVTVTTGENNPPVITSDTDLAGLSVTSAGSVTVNFTVADPDNHAVTVTYLTGSIAETWQQSTTGYRLTIKGNAKDAAGNMVELGTYSSSITATDSYGAETTVEFSYTITPNQAPTCTQIPDQVLVLGDDSTNAARIDLGDYFTDPDGDALSYTVGNTSSTTVLATVTDDILYLTGRSTGSATVTLLGGDAGGLSCSQSFSVTVMKAGDGSDGASVAVSVYPNPVSSVLYIRINQEKKETAVTFYTSNGTKAMEWTGDVGTTDPAAIDVGGLAPGTYSVTISCDGVEETVKVVKI